MKEFIIIIFFLFLVQKHSAQTLYINTIAGDTTLGFSGDSGLALNAKLNQVMDIAFDAHGNLYFCDGGNHRIRKIDTLGIITTVAGNGTAGSSGDGGLATQAQLYHPNAIAVDTYSNIYIADYGFIRKINSFGLISTIAGNGALSYSGDGGPATLSGIRDIEGIAVDALSNIYLSDADPYSNCIRKINSSGIISTIAGNGASGFSGDGGLAINSILTTNRKLAIDSLGNLYFADTGNNRVRKINTSGITTTIAGNGVHGYTGDGGQATNAELDRPTGLAIDLKGNIYILDGFGSWRIRKVNTFGIITTIAGNGTTGYDGDGSPALSANFFGPYSISTNKKGIYINDWSRIRKISCDNSMNKTNSTCNTFDVGLQELNVNENDIKIYPNPNTGNFFVEINNEDYKNLTITDVTGKIVFSKKLVEENGVSINLKSLSAGVYNLSFTGASNRVNKRVVVLN